MASGILRTSGKDIVDANGNTTTLGGWMLMENFINGFPGRENQIRAALLKVLGKEKYDFFFDKFLEYFFTEKDAEFLSSLGFNCLRLSFNYRHFEDDMNPMVIKVEGFKHLDRAIQLCAKYGIYTILDLHSAPGGQNQDWHCDNPTGYAAFWDHKHFQDRVINLWKVIAARYKSNPWVAGFNPLNEPADEQWTRLLSFYDRIVPAIREIDPEHILFLEGNTFSIDFSGFTGVFPNSVYAIHDYCGFGFPNRIGRYQEKPEQDAYIRQMYDRKAAFMKEHNVPVWNGEFGPIYEREDFNPEWETHNNERYNMLDRQMAIYPSESIAWSIWCYKDINVMGLAYLSPESPWLKLLAPMIKKKRDLAYMVQEWADYFKDRTFEELDALAASWKIENCLQRERLNELLKLYAPMTSGDKRLEGKVIQPSVEERTKAKETTSGVGVFELAPDEKRKRIEKVEVTPVPVAA
ncbi:hypothetical protein BN1723_001142 [Verticillium longisporum]|uniref:Glycoside hydrolase family 5 domain-containing protein n=1 Tax=Verticillium longisporum TaxID=100787 RepID=A0A0G4NH78_VERLO|nr:hypothetical protein BN1723_001142 [Verticillium longisporum]